MEEDYPSVEEGFEQLAKNIGANPDELTIAEQNLLEAIRTANRAANQEPEELMEQLAAQDKTERSFMQSPVGAALPDVKIDEFNLQSTEKQYGGQATEVGRDFLSAFYNSTESSANF